jgi:2-polyprenyl-3-methyl-5-hydroxy-6-metoxy-1,4-benzoquinol methylase
LISPDYLDTQAALHADPQGYGTKGSRWAATVLDVALRYDCGSVLDYGCGGGALARVLAGGSISVREYDPAIPGKDGHPSFADLVVCTDVLEHVEPEKLDTVLAHLRKLARKAVFLVVSTRPALRTLPDGRNAHLIVESPAWWAERVQRAGFTVADPPTVWPEKVPSQAWIAVVTP